GAIDETTASKTLTDANRRAGVPARKRHIASSELRKVTQPLQGQTHAQPGPRKNMPTAVSTTASIKNRVMIQNEIGFSCSQRRKPFPRLSTPPAAKLVNATIAHSGARWWNHSIACRVFTLSKKGENGMKIRPPTIRPGRMIPATNGGK